MVTQNGLEQCADEGAVIVMMAIAVVDVMVLPLRGTSVSGRPSHDLGHLPRGSHVSGENSTGTERWKNACVCVCEHNIRSREQG